MTNMVDTDEIEDMMKHIDGYEPTTAVYVGEPYCTNWVYVPREVAEKIVAVVEANEIE